MATVSRGASEKLSAESEPVEEPEFLECGLCFENDELKRLPCNPEHIYCITCLAKDADRTKIIKCPQCRAVFDESIEDIPSAGAPLDKFLCCDVCMRKDDKRRLAQIYCVICQKKFCKLHMDAHNIALDDHQRITMDEYKKEFRKLEIRHCEKHTNRVYSLACKTCHEVFCSTCVVRLQPCSSGMPHDLQDLQNLSDGFIKRINDMKLWIFDKEECLLGLVKQLTRILSDWDNDTEEMITKLHTARDKQIAELTQKYMEHEDRLKTSRNQCKEEVTSFLDRDISDKLDKICRGVKRIDSRLYSHHQVDIVRSKEETEKLANELMNVEIPKYKPSTNYVKLFEKDTPVRTTVEIRASDDSLLTVPETTPLSQTSALTPVAPPTSMTLLRKFEVSKRPESVCHYQGYTYVGCDGCVDRISEDGQVRKAFLTMDKYGSGLTAHKHILYVLVGKSGKHFHVQKHELSGQMMSSWETSIRYVDYNELQVVGDKIIIPDPSKKQLAVYTLTGECVKHIPCQLCIGQCVKICAVGDNSAVVAVRESNTLLRIDIANNKVLWTSNYVVEPAACYKSRYILVISSNNITDIRILILNIDTGESVGEITGQPRDLSYDNQVDFEISDGTLHVADRHASTIEYYQLHD